jgi:prepilin-type processing-associated H-X9-DG protein
MFGRSSDDNESYCTPGWNGDWEVYRWGADPPAPDFTAPDEVAPSRVFGSSHVPGFNCAFADGSVRFIRYSVTPAAWHRACVRNDNDDQQVNPNNL